jgi:hypothetical protein
MNIQRLVVHLNSTDISEEHIASMKVAIHHAGFLLGLFFDPGDGEDMFLRNVC